MLSRTVAATATQRSNRLRVLQVITVLGTGGATKVVLDIANHFNQHPDFETRLLTGPIVAGRTDMTPWAQQRGIATQTVPSLINHINPPVNARAMVALRRIMVAGKFDIVHTHSSVAGIVGRLAAYAAGVPVIVHHVHGWGLKAGMSGVNRLLYLSLERLAARISDRMIVVARPDIDKGLAHKIGPAEKFTLIYNGIDLDKFRRPVAAGDLRSRLGVRAQSRLVGVIGRLDEQKNPCDLIRAAALVLQAYRNVQFLLVGDGPLRAQCERLIAELGLSDDVLLLGYREDVDRIMPLLSLTALSSLWEGLPIAFLEAMSAGKPIVATDVDGARDVVVDGETGFLVAPRDPAAMAERILYLLNDDAARRTMGAVAQQRSNYFSTRRMVGEIETLYRELYSGARRRRFAWQKLDGGGVMQKTV